MTKHFILLYLLLLIAAPQWILAQSSSVFGIIRDAETQMVLSDVSVYVVQEERQVYSDQAGAYLVEQLKATTYELTFFKENYQTETIKVTLSANQKIEQEIFLAAITQTLDAVEVAANAQKEGYGMHRLRNVEGTAIYAAKKTEVIELENIIANLSTNNSRQVYKSIAGLNIWESDGAGLQLSIGARGLDPNRTSNFNTRQNGYDISADALGYPESYYTPPTQALQRIEIVRGAASLQYGSQFGGLLNFILKKGNPNKPIDFLTENTVGSFGLISSFNSIGGSKNGYNYYSFYQHKQGDGWRENAKFEQNTAFFKVSKTFDKRWTIGLEYTFMNYLAQQAGGLQDFEFAQDPRQSKRARNWFRVNWNLAALNFDFKLTEKTKINSRSFVLFAQREALGELGAINRPDPLRERDLISGQYRNFGNETRLISRYNMGTQLATLLVGVRYYQGFTRNLQGDASAGSTADFTFLQPDDPEKSSYEFPSRNLAFFAENLFNISKRWTITPGARVEYIRTASDGFYKQRIFSGGQVIGERKFEDAKENARSLILLGLGVGYKVSSTVEAYANYSQNYRSINFSDLAVVNPNLLVDSLLKDEQGFNADLGIRGKLGEVLYFDASAFYLQYSNRIGLTEIVVPDPLVVEKSIVYRTNIGNARILGLEAYAEANLWKLWRKNDKNTKLSLFANFSWLQGRYLSGDASIVGNDVELIPPFSIKTGLSFRWKAFQMAYQFSYVAQHFSDATNAVFVANATRGIIPSYQVQDISFSYHYHRFRLQAGSNNLTNEAYFTRRATGYPGPGIISADGRSFYLTLGIRL